MTASPYPAPGVEAVLESSPDALLVVTEDGTILRVNAATERMFGYTRDELLGQDHRMLLAEGFRSGLQRISSPSARTPTPARSPTTPAR